MGHHSKLASLDWRYLFASVPGSSHLRRGAHCDDASVVVEGHLANGSPVLIAAVADGAGTASRSSVASKLACRVLTAQISEAVSIIDDLAPLDGDRARSWVAHVVDQLNREADREGVAIREYATTLLAAAVGPKDAVFLQIGDGAMFVGQGDDYPWVFWPQHGEYANTTNFITDRDALNRLEVDHRREEIKEVALMTDGLEHLALNFRDQATHDPFFAPPFGQLRQQAAGHCIWLEQGLEAWLKSDLVNGRTDDDKTLILASRV